jgi:hypothetical protein
MFDSRSGFCCYILERRKKMSFNGVQETQQQTDIKKNNIAYKKVIRVHYFLTDE